MTALKAAWRLALAVAFCALLPTSQSLAETAIRPPLPLPRPETALPVAPAQAMEPATVALSDGIPLPPVRPEGLPPANMIEAPAAPAAGLLAGPIVPGPTVPGSVVPRAPADDAAGPAAPAVAAPLLLEGDDGPEVRPAGSPGCGLAAPLAPPASITVGGRERALITVVPEAYDPVRPHRLVLAFHGRTNTNAQVRRYYGIEGHAGPPTIFVYPAGLGMGSGRHSWWNGGPGNGDTSDYEIFDALVERMRTDYCIDERRIFAVGHSLGGSFVSSLACYRGDLLRGVGIVGGGFVAGSGCRGEVAALLMHNREDRLSLIEWAESARDRILAGNGYRPASMPSEPAAYNCRRYGPPDGPNPVIWCEHPFSHSSSGRYYPHTWPSGAGETIMGFFGALDGR